MRRSVIEFDEELGILICYIIRFLQQAPFKIGYQHQVPFLQ